MVMVEEERILLLILLAPLVLKDGLRRERRATGDFLDCATILRRFTPTFLPLILRRCFIR